MPHDHLHCNNLSVEITDYCNQACTYCFQSRKVDNMHGEGFEREFMDLKSFQKVVDGMRSSDMRFESFTPYWLGEPMLHHQRVEILRYLFDANCQDRFFLRFHMNTNGVLMDPAVSDVLLDYAEYIESGGYEDMQINITLSIDALLPETYKAIRLVDGNQLLRVENNIRYLLARRRERGLRLPNLTYQFVVMDINKEEAQDFWLHWSSMLRSYDVPFATISDVQYFRDRDAIFFRVEDHPDYELVMRCRRNHQEVLQRVGLLLEGEEGADSPDQQEHPSGEVDTREPCFQLWNMMVMSKDGTVVPCCKDRLFELSLGNAYKSGFAQLWRGKKLRQMRLDQIQGNFSKYAVCSTCYKPPGGVVPKEHVLRYLKDIGREDLIDSFLKRIGEGYQVATLSSS
ncbi:MAG: SPASM domain-containing protein [Candidatus Omnitrophica bacterium]|nr:SPASM domain-containing protein [Candidatus Omnitrophota bacterium]